MALPLSVYRLMVEPPLPRWEPESWFLAAAVVRSWLTTAHIGLAVVFAAIVGSGWHKTLTTLAEADGAIVLLQPALSMATIASYVLLQMACRARDAAVLACCAAQLLPAVDVGVNGYLRSDASIYALSTLWGTTSFLAITMATQFLAGVGINMQPLPRPVRAATCCVCIALQTVSHAIVFTRTGNAEAVAAKVYGNVWLVVGTLFVPITRRLAGRFFMCSALADQLVDIGLQAEAVRQGPARHARLSLIYRTLQERWHQLHAQLRLRFGGRYGTIELPEVDRSVEMVASRAGNEGDGTPDLKACVVVCWAAPYTHAFWPCGHLCVCIKCALHWGRGRYGNGACVMCQKPAVDCAHVYHV